MCRVYGSGESAYVRLCCRTGKPGVRVAWDKPKQHFLAAMATHGLPFRQRGRWCCELLKKHSGEGRIVLDGVRAAESGSRSRYGVVQPCLVGRGKTMVHAILHWRTEDVWQFIREQQLPYCSLYDEGFKRIGCVCCPNESNVERAMARWPKLFERIQQRCREVYTLLPSWQRRWRDGDEAFAWWCDRRSHMPSGEDEMLPWDQFDEEANDGNAQG